MTKTIALNTIPYSGTRAKPGQALRYTVSGRGTFPADMLRYDGAEVLSPCELEGRAQREVRIVNARGCTPERWRSFGWSVHPDLEQYQVTGGSPKTTVLFRCAPYNVDSPKGKFTISPAVHGAMPEEVRVLRGLLTACDGPVFMTEASELDLRPGEWPNVITTVEVGKHGEQYEVEQFHFKQLVRDADGDVTLAEYVTLEDSGINARLDVYND